MEFRLLGPMEVLDGDTPVALGGLKQRALLARLLVSPNRTVAVDRLVDDLWGEPVPDSAAKMVQIFVSQLRKVLPDAVLVTRPPGYLVEVDPEAIDVGRFDRLAPHGPRGDRGGRRGSRRGAAARGAGALARRGARRVHRALRADSSATASTNCAWSVSRIASRPT